MFRNFNDIEVSWFLTKSWFLTFRQNDMYLKIRTRSQNWCEDIQQTQLHCQSLAQWNEYIFDLLLLLCIFQQILKRNTCICNCAFVAKHVWFVWQSNCHHRSLDMKSMKSGGNSNFDFWDKTFLPLWPELDRSLRLVAPACLMSLNTRETLRRTSLQITTDVMARDAQHKVSKSLLLKVQFEVFDLPLNRPVTSNFED